MGTTRRESKAMIDSNVYRGGAVSLTRVLVGVTATLVLCLLLAAAPAGAKTVYQYEYSGEFFDGTGSSKGQFKTALGGIDYWPAGQNLMVSVGGEPGIITKFTKTGTPANFSALNSGAGRDYIDLGTSATGEVSVDSSTASSAGNVYLTQEGFGGGSVFGFHANGLPIPAFADADFFGLEGATSGPNGEYWSMTDGNGQSQLQRHNLETFASEEVFLTDETFSDPELGGLKIDSERNFYGIWGDAEGSFSPGWAIKMPKEPIANNSGGTAAKPPEREWRYRLNASSKGTPANQDNAQRLGIDRSNDDVFLYSTRPGGVHVISQYDSKGGLIGSFGLAEGGYEGLTSPGGIAVDPATHDVYVTNNRVYGGETRRVEKFVRGESFTVPDTETNQPVQPSVPSQATLQGVLNPDGIATTECYFEYGTTPGLGTKVACAEGNIHAGSSDIEVTAPAVGLNKAQKYWVKLFAKNSNEVISDGGPEQFIAQSKPIVNMVFADNVNTDGVRLNGAIDPNGGRTWYYWEYGPTDEYGSETPETRLRRETSTETELPESLTQPFQVADLITGLQGETEYHFRLVIKNEQGTAVGPDQYIITYATEAEPSCPNQLVRQQTGAQFLPDCRAYELASTTYSGGADVLSSTVPGKVPLESVPTASGSLLYSLDSAIVPGIAGDPTNLGADPYVAVRGSDGWTTTYAGLPSGGMADPGMFGSPLLETDSALKQFAFGGPDICDPCFGDGSINIPLRRSGGSAEKGMAGSLNPAADPAGEVRKRFSSDGSTFVFGADKRFETAGNEGSVSIYKRSLPTGGTQVVSTMPNGTVMSGSGIAALDVSGDGERVLVGKQVGEDGAGNRFFDLYMHVGNSPNSVEVVDTTNGVSFAGMTEDGSKVFFTTGDQLAGDSDTSSDLFVADVNGSSTITRLSAGSGGSGNTDACAPVGEWNVVSGGPDCSVIAIAGGGGVAEDQGTVYFISPELLDGSENTLEPLNQPTANQPNLYAVRPGEPAEFVATIDSGPPIANLAVVNGRDNSETHSYEDLQVTPDGRFAVFGTDLSLTGYSNLGNTQIHRYDALADVVDCVSCAPTNQPSLSDGNLSPFGLNLTDDGRVFFSTLESYALRDTNGKEDVYQWTNGLTRLISSGLGPDDSQLLSATADGADVFFFTRDILSRLDSNGNAVKIYDARANGGFLVENKPQPCAAADECRGAGTQQPGPQPIHTATGEGTRRPSSEKPNCGALARKAKKAGRQAKRLRRRAARASSSKQENRLRKRARGRASQAGKLSRRAKACRGSNGGSGK